MNTITELENMIDVSEGLTIHETFNRIAELTSDGWDYYNYHPYYGLTNTLKNLINDGRKTVTIFYIKFTSEYLIFTKEIQ